MSNIIHAYRRRKEVEHLDGRLLACVKLQVCLNVHVLKFDLGYVLLTIRYELESIYSTCSAYSHCLYINSLTSMKPKSVVRFT